MMDTMVMVRVELYNSETESSSSARTTALVRHVGVRPVRKQLSNSRGVRGVGGLGQHCGLVAFQPLLHFKSLLLLGIPQPSATRHGSAGSHVL